MLAPVAIGDLAGPSPIHAPDSAPPPSGEIEVGSRALGEPPPVAPPPVLSMPRRGVMKKRSQQTPSAEPAEQGGAEPEPVRADPAVASGTFVTTITDVVGFFSFLGIATLWFGLS